MSFIHLFIGESFQKDQIDLSRAIMLLDISPKEAALTNEDSKKKANTPQQLSFGMSGDLDMVHSRPEWGINENNSSELGTMWKLP